MPSAPSSPADVANMSDDELRQLVEAAEQRQRVLAASVDHKSAVIRKLRDGVRETVEATEREEERMSNALMRRLDSLKNEHVSLKHHLTTEHQSVTKLEGKLRGMAADNAALQESLVEEERSIVKNLRRQIDAVAKQKAELEDKLTLELADVQRHMHRLLQQSAPLQPDSASSRSSSVAADSAAATTSSPQRETPRSSGFESLGATPRGTAAANFSLASSSASAAPTTHRAGSLASDSGMARLLQQEIERVKALEADLSLKNNEYKSRVANLESRLDTAQLERERQRVAADRLRLELSKTVSLTRELVANHELMVEWQTDREVISHNKALHHSRERSVSVVSEAFESQNDNDETPSVIRHTPFSDAAPVVLHGTPRQSVPVRRTSHVNPSHILPAPLASPPPQSNAAA